MLTCTKTYITELVGSLTRKKQCWAGCPTAGLLVTIFSFECTAPVTVPMQQAHQNDDGSPFRHTVHASVVREGSLRRTLPPRPGPGHAASLPKLRD